MTGFTLLWSKMLNSSIWQESPQTRCVWLTLLMLKDKDGVVRGGSVSALARIAHVDPEECQVALDKFLAPDGESSTLDEGGRRLRKIEGGWLLINHEQYRYSTESKREFWRQQKSEQRRREEEARLKRLKSKKKGPLALEVETLAALESGKITQEQADERAAQTRERLV